MYVLDVSKYNGQCELINYNNGYIYTSSFKNYFDKLIKLIGSYHDKIEELEKIKKYKDF